MGKCSVMFRGREVQHDKLGYELLDKLAGEMDDVCTREGRPKREGRNLSMIVTPRPEVVKKVNADRRAVDKAKRKKKEQKQRNKKAAAEAAMAASEEAAATAVMTKEKPNGSDGLLELEKDIESSLDDLFGTDDLTDDLFS